VRQLADIAKAERVAQELLRKYYVEKPPVDPEAIARGEKLKISYVTFSGAADGQISGYVKPDGPEASTIVVNVNQPPARKTYTIAHELGHFLLHPDYVRSPQYQVFPRRDEPDSKKSAQQREADAFAAALLAPLELLARYRTLAKPAELPSLFLVEPELIRARLRRLQQA
jgi:Zn-dependent peptidase ImmA (M78 family)